MSHQPFIPGLDLSERFYWEVVRPILDHSFPGLTHSAALIGYGSEVLGFDSVRSTDHEWGPRLLLFVETDERSRHDAIRNELADRLPSTFLGYSTHFAPAGSDGAQVPAAHERGPVNHKVEVHSLDWFDGWLGRDPRTMWSAVDWISVPQQRLLEVTSGRVFQDGLAQIEPIRSRLSWYPEPVWRYLLACQWQRIAQQEAFVGRTGDVGDDLGSRTIAASLVRDVMCLCFLSEHRYLPYSKWVGTAFARLHISAQLRPILSDVLCADGWQSRERFLCGAYELAAERFNQLELTELIDPTTRGFHDRPYRVLHAERFVSALDRSISDAGVRDIIERFGWAGSVDQMSDNVDLLTRQDLTTTIGDALYR